MCEAGYYCIYPFMIDSVISNVALLALGGVVFFKLIKAIIEALPVV